MTMLETSIGNIKLKNPVLLASGTCGVAGRELLPYIDLTAIGGIVTKSLSIKPKIGNPTPRVVEVQGRGLLNSIGLQNPGVEYFVQNELPFLIENKITFVINVVGDSLDDYIQAVDYLKDKKGFVGIELNLSCPNVDGGLDFSKDPKKAYDLVNEIRKITQHSLWAKLSPNVTDITQIAKACIEAGIDGLSMINTLQGLAINKWTRKPVLPRGVAGYSGPAIKPIALRMVWETYKKFPHIPIIGIGGIHTADDAIEFMLCGASAIQVGTANFVNPKASLEIVLGLKEYCEKNKIGSVSEIVGFVHENKKILV